MIVTVAGPSLPATTVLLGVGVVAHRADGVS